MALPGYCKDTLNDLPTANINAGTNYFVMSEQRWYYYNGTQWTKHIENLTNNQIQSFTDNISAVSNLSDYIDSSLSNQNTTINGLQNQITNFSNSVNGTLGNHQSMITALQNAIETINNSGGGNNNVTIDYTELLLKFNGANNSTDFIDESKNNCLIIPSGNPTISSNDYKFGNSSLYLGGNSALILPSIAFKGDWTIECWIKTNSSNLMAIISQEVGGFSNSQVFLLNINAPSIDYYNSLVGGSGIVFNKNINIIDDQWHHLALVRNKLNIFLYVDGLINANYSNFNSLNLNNSAPFLIGSHSGYGRFFNGFIDYFRISSKAIYTPGLYPNGFNVPDENFQVTQIQSPN